MFDTTFGYFRNWSANVGAHSLLLPFFKMKGVSNFMFAVIIFAVVIINSESAPVDPKKSTEKPSDANGVEDAAGVSIYLKSLY